MEGKAFPGDSGRFAPSGPSHCLARPLRERPASGPLPLPLCGGAQAPGNAFPFHLSNKPKNIAIPLIIKRIAIAFVNLFDYICVALK